MRYHRIFVVLIFFTLCAVTLVMRLFWLQAPAQSHKAVDQRRISILLDNGRGAIVDRNGVPMAGIDTIALLVLPVFQQESSLIKQQLIDVLGAGFKQWMEQTELDYPVLWLNRGDKEPVQLTAGQIAAVRNLHVHSVLLTPYRHRYANPPIASHLIGYVHKDGYGGYGLEKSLERYLRTNGKTKYVTYRDGRSQGLSGLNGDYGKQVQTSNGHIRAITTIDIALQRRLEALATRDHMDDGAVVVLDAKSSDILAMVSKPDYNPYSVDPEQGNWRNRAITADIPGSIFKTVVAAATFESGLTTKGQMYHCDGKHRSGFPQCWLQQGHGSLSLEEAFAQSCNTTFSSLAVELGPKKLADMAAKLGIGRKVGWSTTMNNDSRLGEQEVYCQLDGEGAGQLFDKRSNREDAAVLAQTGIGQHDVRMTPLQAANMVIPIVNSGWMAAPRVVSRIQSVSGGTLLSFPLHNTRVKALAGGTATFLRKAMVRTVTEGTANLLANIPGGVGGKTGTAETGDKKKTHHWFVGFAPADNPRYVFAIVVRDQSPNGPNQAVRFAKSMLMESEMKFR